MMLGVFRVLSVFVITHYLKEEKANHAKFMKRYVHAHVS